MNNIYSNLFLQQVTVVSIGIPTPLSRFGGKVPTYSVFSII